MASRFSIEAVFKAVDRMSAPVSKMQSRISRFTRSATRNFKKLNRNVDKFGRGLKRATIGAAAGIAIMTASMVSAINTGADFEQALVGAAAKFPSAIVKGTQAFKELEDVARKVGATTEFTATQAAQGLNFLAFAGFNAEQAIAALPGVIDLATAAQIELGDASNIATDALGAFGLASKDGATLARNLARVNDVLARTTTSANTDMTMLFETIKKGGPVASGAGASIETFAALAGTMANSSLKASEAGSTIKNMFLRLTGPTTTAAKLLRRLGVDTRDSAGNMLDIVDIIGSLDKGLKGFGTADRLAILSEIFGARAVTGVNILLESGIENLRRYREQLQNASGTVGRMASLMRDTTRGAIFNMNSAIEGATISFFKMNQVRIDDLIGQITKMVRQFDEAIKSNETLVKGIQTDFIDVVFGAIKVIGILIATFVGLKLIILSFNALLVISKVAIVAYTGAMWLWRNAMVAFAAIMPAVRTAVLLFNLALFANPIGLVVAGIGLLIGAGALLILNWDKIKSGASNLWGGLVDIVSSSVDKIKGFLDTITSPFKQLFSGVSGLKQKFSGLFGGAEIPISMNTPSGLGRSPQVTNVGAGVSPNLVTPQEVTARQIEERRETSTAELLIKGETSLVELSGFNNNQSKSRIKLQRTGTD